MLPSWEVIKKEDLAEFFREFHENGVVNNCTNALFICLIPKKEDDRHQRL